MSGNPFRPRDFSGFVGQSSARNNLQVFMQAAIARQDVLDHVLIYGPPGLGKTTLAGIIATGMLSSLRMTSAPAIERTGDLASLLSGLEQGDILFIDEIHRLPMAVEEMLYSVMEDCCLDLMIGEGSQVTSVRVDLPRFTLVGATTRVGGLSKPLRDRFGIDLRLEFYSPFELGEILKRQAAVIGVDIDEEAALELGRRSRGTPRIAGRLLRRVRDFATVDTCDGKISGALVCRVLDRLGIDALGLDCVDRRYLEVLATHYAGGPAGLNTLAVSLSEPNDTIEDVIEPYLMREGLIARESRGRVLTDKGWLHVGMRPPAKVA